MEKWAVRFKTPTSEGFRYCTRGGEIRPFDGKAEAEKYAEMCRDVFDDTGSVYEVVPYPTDAVKETLRVGFRRGKKWVYKTYYHLNREDANRLLDDLRAGIMDCDRITITRRNAFRLNDKEEE